MLPQIVVGHITETYASDIASERSDSASMSRSESEAEFAPGEDKPIFPYEKLYYDAADKASIQAKPEIEREEILAQRSEQVDRHEQDLTLRRLLAARAKETAKTEARNKRKAAAADLDDGQRKSSRQRTKLGGGRVGEKSTAIEAYKQQRAEKNLRDEQRRSRVATKAAGSLDDDFSDADAEGESDNDFDDHKYKKRTPTPPKDEPIADLSDIQRARVGRDNFAQVCYTPGFEDAITDCYARVCLGPGRNPGVNEYRVCTIKGFSSGKPYAMTAASGRPFLVDKYIIAAHGKAQKPWSFLECSMSKFTEEEWRRYRVVMANEDCKIPTRSFVNAKLGQISKLLNHKFTEVEISEKIRKQNALLDKVNRTADQKAIRQQIDQAVKTGDDDKIAELEEQLANIMPMKLAFNTTLSRPENAYVNKEAEKMAELNRRNQKLNAETVRKAQLAEMRYKKKKLVVPGSDDLFGSASDISRAGTPVNGGKPAVSGTATPNGNPSALTMANGNITPGPGTPSNGNATKPIKKGLPVIKKVARDDEILATMDLGIDIDI